MQFPKVFQYDNKKRARMASIIATIYDSCKIFFRRQLHKPSSPFICRTNDLTTRVVNRHMRGYIKFSIERSIKSVALISVAQAHVDPLFDTICLNFKTCPLCVITKWNEKPLCITFCVKYDSIRTRGYRVVINNNKNLKKNCAHKVHNRILTVCASAYEKRACVASCAIVNVLLHLHCAFFGTVGY